MKNNYVVGLGEILWDVLPDGKKLGGAPANFAWHAAQFGVNSLVVSAVGNDDLGDEIISIFKEKNRNFAIERISYPTGVVEVDLKSNGVPEYTIHENSAWDYIPFTERLEGIAKNTRAVCFGSLAQRNTVSRETIHHFLDAMPLDSMKIFDINLRLHFYNKEILAASLVKCSIVKLNDEELEVLTSMFGLTQGTQEEQCRDLLQKFSLKIVILTCGATCSYIVTEHEVSYMETPKVKVVDTVGAGDSFTGSFCAAILKGVSIQQAHHLAVEVAGYVCTQKGATPEIPLELRVKL